MLEPYLRITIRRLVMMTFEILSFLLPRLWEILRLHSIRFSPWQSVIARLSLEYAPAPFRFFELDRKDEPVARKTHSRRERWS
jgi:hypothetical protein